VNLNLLSTTLPAVLQDHGFRQQGRSSDFVNGLIRCQVDGEWLVFRQRSTRMKDDLPGLWKTVTSSEIRADIPLAAIQDESCSEETTDALLSWLTGVAPVAPELSWLTPELQALIVGAGLDVDLAGRLEQIRVSPARICLAISADVPAEWAEFTDELLAHANRSCRMVRFFTAPMSAKVHAEIRFAGLPVATPGLIVAGIEALKAGAQWLSPSLDLLLADNDSLQELLLHAVRETTDTTKQN
jgi:hypothetical protein